MLIFQLHSVMLLLPLLNGNRLNLFVFLFQICEFIEHQILFSDASLKEFLAQQMSYKRLVLPFGCLTFQPLYLLPKVCRWAAAVF